MKIILKKKQKNLDDVIREIAEKTGGKINEKSLLRGEGSGGVPNANTREFSCWTCKHFEPWVFEGVAWPFNGSCRAVPPTACCDPNADQFREDANPIWPALYDPAISWCSTWQQRQSQDDLGVAVIPGPPPGP